MRLGKITETVWKKNIGKVLQVAGRCGCLSTSACPESTGVVTVSTCVSGASPKTACCGILSVLNELAIKGARPEGILLRMLLPETAEENWLRQAAEAIKALCEETGACQEQVVRINIDAEVLPSVYLPVVSVTAVGGKIPENSQEDKNREKAGAGQSIILLGTVGLEGALRVLDEREPELAKRFVPAFLEQAKRLNSQLYAVPWIEMARKSGATAMKQITEGGIFAALWELTEEAETGMETELSKISICQETVEICEYFHLNPYQMTSAGSVLMLTKQEDKLLGVLRAAGARAEKLGVTTEAAERVILGQSEKRYLDRPAPDELVLWRKREMSGSCPIKQM